LKVIFFHAAGKLNVDHGLLLCASATVTASLASFVLGVIMVAVILLARSEIQGHREKEGLKLINNK
jgi:hypothetical protein